MYLGWLPEPTPPTMMNRITRVAELPCHNCDGNGWGYGTIPSGRINRVTCWVCGGSGVEPGAAAT